VTSARANQEKLTKLMPAYLEYLDSLPSVLDLVRDAPRGVVPVRYDDEGETISGGKAFVFRPRVAENSYRPLSVTDLVEI
jgi:hypothetical protein